MSTTENPQRKCLVVFLGVSFLSSTKNPEELSIRFRPDGTFFTALDLQTQGLLLTLCFKAQQLLWLMGGLLAGSHCSATTVEKYPIALEFCSQHCQRCGSFSWLEGDNILFLSQRSWSPSQAAQPPPNTPSGDLWKSEPFCAPDFSEELLGTQEKAI